MYNLVYLWAKDSSYIVFILNNFHFVLFRSKYFHVPCHKNTVRLSQYLLWIKSFSQVVREFLHIKLVDFLSNKFLQIHINHFQNLSIKYQNKMYWKVLYHFLSRTMKLHTPSYNDQSHKIEICLKNPWNLQKIFHRIHLIL